MLDSDDRHRRPSAGDPLGGPRVGPQSPGVSDDARVRKLLAELIERQQRRLEQLTREAAEAAALATTAVEAQRQAEAEAARLRRTFDELTARLEESERELARARRHVEATHDARRQDLATRDERITALERELSQRCAELSHELQQTESERGRLAAEVDRLTGAVQQQELRASQAEAARERAQQGSASFQKLVESSRGAALAAERRAVAAEAALERAERIAAECTHRAEQGEAHAALAEHELIALREADGAALAAQQQTIATQQARLTELEALTADGRAATQQQLDALRAEHQQQLATAHAEHTRLLAAARAEAAAELAATQAAAAAELERTRNEAAAELDAVRQGAADELGQVRRTLETQVAERRAACAAAETLAAAATAGRERLLQLADRQRLAALEQEAERLWPCHPDRVPALEAWLAEAEGLLLTLDEHRQLHDRLVAIERTLAPLAGDEGFLLPWGEAGASASPPGKAPAATAELPGAGAPSSGAGDPRRWTLPELLWWKQGLGEIVAGIERLARPQQGLLADVQRRLAVSKELHRRTLGGKTAQAAWATARASIADRKACPAYDGLLIEPQLGLLPIGRDQDSGLWEFCLPHTGKTPLRTSAGRLLLEEESALVLVLLPGGRSRLGAQAGAPGEPHHDPAARRDEGPVHELGLRPFFIAKHAMTQGQWERFTGSNPSRYPPGTRLADQTHDLRHPVENVSWNECAQVLARLGLALPTEAQWEYAARAGTRTPWWTGQERDSLLGAVNLADQAAARGGASWAAIQDWPALDDGYTAHAPVDHGRANPFGLHGIHGNVWEWCADARADYGTPARADDGLRQAGDPAARIFRGGGFRSTASQARSASRQADSPEKRSSDLGVRPARPVDGDVRRGG